MINALGLLEVCGLTASIEAADAMLKAAQVRLLSHTVTPPGMITLVIEGDLAACRAALDAGSAAASRLGQVIVRKEIGRPETDTEWFVLNLQPPQTTTNQPSTTAAQTTAAKPTAPTAEVAKQQPATETQTEALAPTTAETVEITEQALVALIAKHPQGRNLTDLIQHFNAPRGELTMLLKNCVADGTLRKKGNRYYIVEGKK